MKNLSKKIYTFLIIVVIIFDLFNINPTFAGSCSSCSSDSCGWRSWWSCTDFATYSSKAWSQTCSWCDSWCNPPSSYWWCTPAQWGSCDNWWLWFRTYSGNWTNNATNYYCLWTSCWTPCSPNTAAWCLTSCVTYIDIWLKYFDWTSIIKIAIESWAATSPLRIAKNWIIYGIVLVATNDPMASKMIINTSAWLKALRKLP